MRNWHLVLSDGTERNFMAASAQVIGEALIFVNTNGELLVAYAGGEWKYVEVEQKDDKD